MEYSLSSRYKNLTNSAGTAYLNNNAIQSETQYLVNLSYDVNPAMRIGIEWDYIKTKYANYGNPIPGSGATAVREGLYAGNDGSMNAFRFGAWYFF
jgi:predicted porin